MLPTLYIQTYLSLSTGAAHTLYSTQLSLYTDALYTLYSNLPSFECRCSPHSIFQPTFLCAHMLFTLYIPPLLFFSIDITHIFHSNQPFFVLRCHPHIILQLTFQCHWYYHSPTLLPILRVQVLSKLYTPTHLSLCIDAICAESILSSAASSGSSSVSSSSSSSAAASRAAEGGCRSDFTCSQEVSNMNVIHDRNAIYDVTQSYSEFRIPVINNT